MFFCNTPCPLPCATQLIPPISLATNTLPPTEIKLSIANPALFFLRSRIVFLCNEEPKLRMPTGLNGEGEV